MADPTNPNDPEYLANPENYVFVNGRWQFRNSAASGNAPDPTGSNRVDAASVGTPFPGLESLQLDGSAPGASLSATQSDNDRTRLSGYLEQLRGQAATGSGAWEQVLAQNTTATKAGAMALGQSQDGVDPMTAARNIGNAAAGADQRAVGQGNLLRAQTKQQATGQLTDLLSGQQALDAQQSATAGAANQGRFGLNQILQGQAKKAALDTTQKGIEGVTSLGSGLGMSEGGEVPGTPKVFGDDEINDTVPALLSPDEIVIPISITSRPDAPEAAARFVAAVKARGTSGGPNFDEGGQVGPYGEVNQAGQLKKDSSVGETGFTAFGSPQWKASIANGGLLDTGPYNQTREAGIENSDRLAAAGAGRGPSVAPQAFQNATDTTLADALRAGANSRRPNASLVGMAAEQQQGAAGNAAGIAAGEQQRGGASFADAVNRQRAQDLSFATAQQQAAWRNSMMNAGIGLEQQAQLKNLLGSAGQGAAALSVMFQADNGPSHDFSANASSYDRSPSYGGGDHSDSSYSYDDESADHYAEGGIVEQHLTRRQGTTRAPKRPDAHRQAPTPAPGAPRATGLETRMFREKREESEGPASTGDRERIHSLLKQIESNRRQQYDAENPDLKDLQLNYAEGGVVFPPEGPDTPQSGPFDANAGVSGSILDILAGAFRHPDMPRRGEDVTPTPEQLAARPMGSRVRPVEPPVEPAQPHGAPARERPFIAQPARPVAPAAPTPQATQSARPAAAPAQPRVDPYAEQRAALGQKAEVEGQQADANAEILGGLQRGLKENAVAQKEMQARASEAAQSQLQALEEARAELKNIDVTVDPDRYMARKGWGGRIAAVIGLVLGAIGNDNGVNRAAMLINQNIDRDLDIQKSEHEFQLRKGQANVDAAQNIYALSRQMTQDDIAANLAARGTMLDLAKNQVDLAAAKVGAPMAKANLANLSAALSIEKQKADDAMKQRGFDNHIKLMNADTDRLRAQADVAGAGAKAAAGDKTQAALIANVEQENKTIQEQGRQLKALIKKHGTSGGLTGPGKAEMQQTLTNMATAAAKLRDPNSVARSSEVEAELKNLFQPGILQQESTANAAIDNYLRNMEARRNDAYQVRGLQAPGVAGSPAPAAIGATREVKGKKYRREADGWHEVSP